VHAVSTQYATVNLRKRLGRERCLTEYVNTSSQVLSTLVFMSGLATVNKNITVGVKLSSEMVVFILLHSGRKRDYVY